MIEVGCHTRGHVQHEDRFYRMACLAGGHVLEELMSFIRTCIMGGHVICRTSLAGSHVLWGDMS